MKVNYFCEKCGESFNEFEFDKCLEHEKNCDKKKENIFICYKCGKVIRWKNDDSDAFIKLNQKHHINLGRMGYGSDLDNLIVEFDLCDSCLTSFIDTFELKDEIYNSKDGSYFIFESLDETTEEENKIWEDDMTSHDN